MEMLVPKPITACTECGIQFSSDDAFNLHFIEQHIEIKQELLENNDIHGNDYTTILKEPDLDLGLTKHFKLIRNATGHNKRQSFYSCSICAYTCIQERTFKLHCLKHVDPNPKFACDQCGKLFFSMAIMKRHAKIHNKSKFYCCEVENCDKKFITKSRLTDHLRYVHKLSVARNNKIIMNQKTDNALTESDTIQSQLNDDCDRDIKSCFSDSQILNSNQDFYLSEGTSLSQNDCLHQILHTEQSEIGVLNSDNLYHESYVNDIDDNFHDNDCRSEIGFSHFLSQSHDSLFDESKSYQNVESLPNMTTGMWENDYEDVKLNLNSLTGDTYSPELNNVAIEVYDSKIINSENMITVCDIIIPGIDEQAETTASPKVECNTSNVSLGNPKMELQSCYSSKNKRKNNSGFIKATKLNIATKFKCTFLGCSKSFRDNYNLRMHMYTHTGQRQRACEICGFTCVQKSALDKHIKGVHKRT